MSGLLGLNQNKKSLTGIKDEYFDNLYVSNEVATNESIVHLTATTLSSNNATINNLAVNSNASVSFLTCSTLNGTNSSYYNNVTSDIQAQIDGIVNSASVGGGGYFVLSAETSTLALGYNWAFGGNQSSSSLYNVMPACTLIGLSITSSNSMTGGTTIDVYKNGISILASIL